MKKRILSVVLSAAMAFVGIAAGVWEPVTVYAGEEPVTVSEEGDGNPFGTIYIDGSGNLNPSEEPSGNDNDKYFVITGSGVNLKYKDVTPTGGTEPETYNFHYNSSSHTLTLKDMNVSLDEGNVIASEYKTDKLTIELIGTNKVETASGEAICLNGNTTVTGSGVLTAVTTSGKLTDEQANEYYPAAIQIGEGCKRFENHATITADAENGTPAFSAWHLTYGDMNQSYIDEESIEHMPTGRILNRGTITGSIGLFDGIFNGLVPCDTQYGKPNDGHTYIGKAYYFTKEDLYSNNVIGTLPDGTGRVVGKYDENGEPMPSKVWYQWIYTDVVGSVYTEDRVNPVQFLVYPEDSQTRKVEDLLTPNDVAAVDDGEEHTFNTDLYAVWHTDGKVTVNGNVTLDVACSSAPVEVEKDAAEVAELVEDWEPNGIDKNKVGNFATSGAMCYVKDTEDVDQDGDKDEVLFHDSSNSSVTITGDVGYLSLSDTYQGDVTVNGNINFCALYKEREFLKNWIYRLQWQFDGSPYHPGDVPYCAVPNGGLVVDNGKFTKTVTDLAFAEGVELKGSGLYDGTYFVQTETKVGEVATGEEVAGTSAAVGGNSLLVNVSKKSGLDTNTYPLVRKTTQAAEQNISSHLSNRANMVAMDIAVIKQTKNEKDEVTAQAKTEPNGMVNLYFDRIDLSKLKNPALFHIKDNGVVEKLVITKSGSDSASASVKCQTGSFSTYVFAEDQSILYPSSSGGGGWSYGGSSGSSDTTDKTPTETKPDGTKVETNTETKADGTRVDTKVETKADGTKVETVVETAKDGSVKTTETVTQADGSATKTEKESEKNTKGKDVAVTTTTKTDADGKVTGITQTSEIEQISGSTSATVTVEKTADGKITSAEAEVDKKGANNKQGVKATLFGSVVAQIIEAAGTQVVEISMTVTVGKKEYTVKADAQDLETGNKLKVMAINEKTGKHVLVNAKTYTVSESGNVKLTLPAGMNYQLMDTKEAAVVEKQILATVKVKKTSATIAEGKKLNVQMSKKLDMDNVAKITYSTSKKSVAAVSKNGQVTGENTGSAVITVKVTLNNGKTKTLKMRITVS